MSDEKKRMRGCVWGCARWGILFLAIFAVSIWRLLFVSVPLEISPETTIVTEPRTPDGKEVDFWAYIQSQFPKDIATDRNAARRLVRIFGSFDSIQAEGPTPERDALVFEKLGLENVEPQLTFQIMESAYRKFLERKYPEYETSKEQGDLFWDEYEAGNFDDLSSPVYDETFRRMWLEANSPALDAFIREMDAADFFFYPLIRMEDEKILFSLQLPHTDLLKDFSDALFFRAASQLLDGDVDGAIRDRNAGLRILRKCREPLLVFVEELEICRMERKFLSLPLKTVPEKTLTAEQLQTLREISWDTGRKEQKKKLLKHDMLSILDLFQRLSAGKAGVEDIQAVLPEGRSRKGLAEFLFLRVGYDWNAASRFMQNRYWKMLNREEDLEYEKLRTGNLFFHLLDSRERAKHLALLFTEPASWLFYSQLALDEISESLAHIGYAMELYRLEHGGKLPPAFTRDAEGKPLHSWRVLILPYLGEKEKALYEQIRLDEPWDSEWNRQFHAQMPVFYRSGSITHWRVPDPDPLRETRLTVIQGKEGLFNDSGEGVDPAQFVQTDPERRLGKMVLVLDRCEAVCWMKPDAELKAEELIRGWEEELERETLVLFPTLAVYRLSPNDIEYDPENDVTLWATGKPAPTPTEP